MYCFFFLFPKVFRSLLQITQCLSCHIYSFTKEEKIAKITVTVFAQQDDLIAATATPPMYLQTDLQTFDLHELPTKFDVILVEPPLEEYQHTGVTNVQFWDWQKIMDLDIAQVRMIPTVPFQFYQCLWQWHCHWFTSN